MLSYACYFREFIEAKIRDFFLLLLIDFDRSVARFIHEILRHARATLHARLHKGVPNECFA